MADCLGKADEGWVDTGDYMYFDAHTGRHHSPICRGGVRKPVRQQPQYPCCSIDVFLTLYGIARSSITITIVEVQCLPSAPQDASTPRLASGFRPCNHTAQATPVLNPQRTSFDRFTEMSGRRCPPFAVSPASLSSSTHSAAVGYFASQVFPTSVLMIPASFDRM